MAQSPNIPTPKEPVGTQEIGGDGKPTGNMVVNRTWWRFWNTLGVNSGSLSKPVTIAPNSVITPGTINSGSTVTLANSPPLTILGNSTNAPAPPEPQVVDPSLSFNGGTLAALAIPAGTLSGNPGPDAKPPGAILLGTDLSLFGNVLNVTPSGGGVVSMAMVKAIVYWGM
jgi:hypothetical protein